MKRKRLRLIILIITIVIIILTYFMFFHNTLIENYLNNQNFYFYSDDLNINKIHHDYGNWNQEKIRFNVTNYLDEKITKEDIEYTVTCNVINNAKGSAKCLVNGTNTNNVNGILSSENTCRNSKENGIDVSNYTKTNCELEAYTWEQEKTNSEMYVEIELDEKFSFDEIEIEISVKATTPHTKTIEGIWSLNYANNESTYQTIYQNYDTYDKLIIINDSSSTECLSIKFPNDKLSIDEINESIVNLFTDYKNKINEVTVEINPYSSGELNFYTNNKEDLIDINSFEINRTGGCS